MLSALSSKLKKRKEKNMKKLILLLSMGLLQAKDISGTYIVTTVIENGKTEHPNAEVTFKSDGKYYMMGAPFGQWKSSSGNTVLLNTAFEPKFEKYTVINSANELILQNAKGKLVYKKINKQKIQANNANSMLLGSWIYKKGNNSQKIIFSKPDNFKCIEQNYLENSITKGSGKWLYNNNSITITAFGCSLSGKYKVKKSGNGIVIDGKKFVRE